MNRTHLRAIILPLLILVALIAAAYFAYGHILIKDINGPLHCDFGAHPQPIAKPGEAVTIEWQCNHSVSCVVTNLGAGTEVAHGGNKGTEKVMQSAATTYHIVCDTSNTEHQELHAFDATSRVEVAQ